MQFTLLSVLFTATIIEAGVLDIAATHFKRQGGGALSSPDKPTQPDIAANCDAFYDVVGGDNCALVETKFGITHAQFLEWNVGVLTTTTPENKND